MSSPENKSNDQIKKEIINFLDQTCGLVDSNPGEFSCGTIHRNCLVLATSHQDVPRATPLEFFNEDLTIYILGEPGGKTTNIKRNQKVSAAIYEQPMVHHKLQKSLQIFGNAELITMKNNMTEFKSKAKKWNMYTVVQNLAKPFFKDKNMSEQEKMAAIEKILSTMTLIKITPDHIVLREYHPDFTTPKYVWRK
jgi:nitroimidazol reductase NimA-like FMN-containing flavoprotein (pyridoxamine 5'-phosphate oxidase superfamily)